MDRVKLFEYDKGNREDVASAISQANGEMVSWSYFAKDQKSFSFPPDTTHVYIDVSSLFYSENRADSLISALEIIINGIVGQNNISLITERQYSQTI